MKSAVVILDDIAAVAWKNEGVFSARNFLDIFKTDIRRRVINSSGMLDLPYCFSFCLRYLHEKGIRLDDSAHTGSEILFTDPEKIEAKLLSHRWKKLSFMIEVKKDIGPGKETELLDHCGFFPRAAAGIHEYHFETLRQNACSGGGSLGVERNFRSQKPIAIIYRTGLSLFCDRAQFEIITADRRFLLHR